MYYYINNYKRNDNLLIVIAISMQTTVSLLLPHPVSISTNDSHHTQCRPDTVSLSQEIFVYRLTS